MKISEVFKSVNSNVREEDLKPASLIKNEAEKERYSKETGKRLQLFTEVKRIADKFGFDANKIYFTSDDKGMANYYYYNFPTFVSISSYDEEYINNFEVSKRIKQTEKYFEKLMEEKDYERIISLVDGKIRILTINKIYHMIPNNKKYEWFMEVYTLEDYGFADFNAAIIEDAFSKQTKEQKQDVQKKLLSKGNEEEIIIYRGMGSESTSLELSYSWTLSFEVACFFANRFNMNGEVYIGKVKKEKVIDYLTGRNEEEIIVRPEDIYEIKSIDLVKTSDELKKLENTYTIGDFHYALQDFNENLFFDSKGIHGLLHMKRVLIHVISLSLEMDLDDTEKNMLINAALYHDIGRDNDYKDDLHGKKSWEKVIEKDIWNDIEQKYELYDTEKAVVQFIIENHCLDDQMVWENLNKSNFNIYSKEEVKKLMSIFKDADGLDRVRLGDLKISFLRTEAAKKRYMFAQDLLNGVK